MSYEYKVVPAPVKGVKAKGVKGGAEAQFAHALSELMNNLAADGWEYQRADTLPNEARSGGLTGKTTVFRNMLVFRRALEAQAAVATPVGAPLSVEEISAPSAPPAPHTDVQDTHAPALPSAHAAQELPEVVKPLEPAATDGEAREVAAE